jgi:hypothetical protein
MRDYAVGGGMDKYNRDPSESSYITLFSLGLGVMPGILPLLAMGLPSTS